eukprot:gene1513-1905_t
MKLENDEEFYVNEEYQHELEDDDYELDENELDMDAKLKKYDADENRMEGMEDYKFDDDEDVDIEEYEEAEDQLEDGYEGEEADEEGQIELNEDQDFELEEQREEEGDENLKNIDIEELKRNEKEQIAIRHKVFEEKLLQEHGKRKGTAIIHSIRNREQFGKWEPKKKISREEMDELRTLHKEDPEHYDVKFLSNHYQLSIEAIKRILKSKWKPSAQKLEHLHKRKIDEQKKIYKAVMKPKLDVSETLQQSISVNETEQILKETNNFTIKNRAQLYIKELNIKPQRFNNVEQQQQQQQQQQQKQKEQEQEKEMSKVANIFDLLQDDDDIETSKDVKKTQPAKKAVVAPTKPTETKKPVESKVTPKSDKPRGERRTNNNNNNNGSAANGDEGKAPYRRDGKTHTRQPRTDAAGNIRNRQYDRKSGTGRPINGEDKRRGAGKGNWGTPGQADVVDQTAPAKTEEEETATPAVAAPEEPKDTRLTLEEYLNQQQKEAVATSTQKVRTAGEGEANNWEGFEPIQREAFSKTLSKSATKEEKKSKKNVVQVNLKTSQSGSNKVHSKKVAKNSTEKRAPIPDEKAFPALKA